MLLSYAAAILDRDLRTLQREVEAYPAEGDLWTEVGGLPNVGGTLALHLVGNIQYYVGAVLGKTGYLRDRPAEFARRHVPRTKLVREIEAARDAVSRALSAAPDTEADYPELIAGKHVTTGEYLMHLTTHFAYHLGQLDYHRRFVTGKQDGVGAVQPVELRSAR